MRNAGAALTEGLNNLRRNRLSLSSIHRHANVYFRMRRMRQFCELFMIKDSTRIIDVGGYEFNWTLINQKPHVLLVNVENEQWTHDRISKIRGDGRSLNYPDNTFDIAYSNSVIEHVGTFNDQQAFAEEIRRVARRYYVQTPNKWFFVEPHLVMPFLHFLPRKIMRKLARYGSVWGWTLRPDQDFVDRYLASIRLLDRREMQKLFPDADVIEERFLGMTKSLIACRF
jgi:hypothetical protein